MTIGRIPGATGIQPTIVDAKGDIIAATAADSVTRLAVGANETRVVADSAQATGLKYVADTTNYAIAAKGDLLAGTAADTLAALTVAANTAVLTADSTAATGLAWDGIWTNFTPSWTGLTVGNGTQVARYRKVGKTVDVYVKFTLGSTSSLSASLNYFALPFNLAYTSNGDTVIGGLDDASPADNKTGIGEFNGNNIIISALATNATFATHSRVTSTNPFTWTTNDSFWISVRYEAA
jgi:hypothetical protein